MFLNILALLMLNEIDKFRVQIFQVSGFAFMVPFGRFFLEPWTLVKELNAITLIIYFLFTLSLEFCGILLILKSYDILESRRKIK